MVTKVKFGGTVKEQNELSEAVLKGEKTATSSLVEIKSDNELTLTGDIWAIFNGFDEYICAVEVINVENKKFKDITEKFALEEGDGSFENWQRIHKIYYSYLLNKQNKELSGDTLLECVNFKK